MTDLMHSHLYFDLSLRCKYSFYIMKVVFLLIGISRFSILVSNDFTLIHCIRISYVVVVVVVSKRLPNDKNLNFYFFWKPFS